MFSLNARLAASSRLLIKGAWAAAWGEPEDLVSGLSPLPGYVLPRHWGHWAEETMLGLAWTQGRCRLSVAGARRLPNRDDDCVPVTQYWGELQFRW